MQPHSCASHLMRGFQYCQMGIAVIQSTQHYILFFLPETYKFFLATPSRTWSFTHVHCTYLHTKLIVRIFMVLIMQQVNFIPSFRFKVGKAFLFYGLHFISFFPKFEMMHWITCFEFGRLVIEMPEQNASEISYVTHRTFYLFLFNWCD